MAHTCPSCGVLCHCNGDWDDIDFGEDYNCRHYLECDTDQDDDWDDEPFFGFDDEMETV